MIGVSAQTSNTGSVTGVVKDETGAVVPGATIKMINTGTNAERTSVTSGEGAFEISQLVPGNYRLEVEKASFAKYVHEQVTVNVLSRVTIEPVLRPAGATAQVTVTAENAALVETTKTEVGGVIDQRQMENLPVNGRSFASLAVLIPGATLAPSFDPTKARVGTFSIGGSTGRNLNITVDGGDNKDNAVGGILQNFSMEGIQEFALSTQRFSAANGRSGGALLSVVSKGGTNDLHGSAFGFFRDEKLNANAPALLAKANDNIFAAGDAVKPPFGRQQFGGSFGGPIKKNKAFFFGTFERTRERGNSIVSSADQAQIATLTSFGYNAVRFLSQPFNDSEYTIKGDFNLSSKHTLVTRFSGQNNNALNDQAGFLVVRTDLSGGNKTLNTLYNFLASETWTVNPSTVNQFVYQYSTFDNQILATTDLANLSFPSGIIVGRNGNVPQETIQKKHQFRDDLTYNRGNHGFKFGADFVYEPTLGGIFAFSSSPSYEFYFDPSDIAQNPGQFPQGFRTHQVLPGPITCAVLADSGCTAADLAGFGVVADIVLAGGDPSFNLRDGAKQFGWYAQDDWKVTPRLTLNFGVRYDVDIGFVDAGHQKDNRALRALQIIGSPFGGVAKDDKNNFSPRVGFAWDIHGNARSVVRGGYGIYFDQSFLNVPLFAVQLANPEIYASFLNDGDNLAIDSAPPTIPRPLSNPLPGSRGRTIDPNFVAPYSQQSNVGFAQELGKNMALEFDYVHILGLHEFTSLDINPRTGPLHNAQRGDSAGSFPRVLAPQFTAHAAELLAAFGTTSPFARITTAQSVSRSRYDGFTVTFKRRYANKYQLNAHYTLAKSRAWFGQSSDFGNQAQNVFDQWNPENFGPTDTDERHRFVLSGVFDLPWGFQVAPIFQAASPRPYSIFPSCGCDINRDGVTVDRDSVNPGVDDQHHLPLNPIRGDSFKQLNVRVSKFFNFGERAKLGLFFEAFNVFNTANFGREFQNVTGTPDFGKPLNFFGATGFSEPLGIPFQAQLGARFTF